MLVRPSLPVPLPLAWLATALLPLPSGPFLLSAIAQGWATLSLAALWHILTKANFVVF